jgi:hypothetical protein
MTADQSIRAHVGHKLYVPCPRVSKYEQKAVQLFELSISV